MSVQSQVDRESPQEASLRRETYGIYEPFRIQEDVVTDWQPVHSLMGAAVSGTEIAMTPCVPTLLCTCLSSPQGNALKNCQLAHLWYSLGRNPLSVSAPGVTVPRESLPGEKAFVFLCLSAIPMV